MTAFIYRATGICPAEHRDALNHISTKLGYGDSFSVPLSSDGTEPATHYGTSTIATPQFIAMMTDPPTQEYVLTTIDWDPMTEAEVRAILAAQRDTVPAVFSIGPASERGIDQLQALMTAHGLQMVQSGDLE